jgi:4-diphosphocytidyl-2-C-methyl-D-erythritol kinase
MSEPALGEGGLVGARLRARAPAKINLCLFLGAATRADGRHELVTLFESVSLCDSLELEVAPTADGDRVFCPEVDGENLAAVALSALRERGWEAPPVRLTITKRVPIAAGMAGGSADAAAALRLAVALSPSILPVVGEIAASLGADVPGQLTPGLSIGTGAGELVSPREPLAEHAALVLPSHERLTTADVYS